MEKNQLDTTKIANEPARDALKLAKISSAKSFYSTSKFLAHSCSPDIFMIAKASTKRKTRPLLHKLASSLHRSVSFACGMWPSAGRGVVRASHIHSTKIKTVKISSEESGGIFGRFCTSKNFPLYGTYSHMYLWFTILLVLTQHIRVPTCSH